MLKALYCEWLKVRHNVGVSLFTIGALPALAFILLTILAILGAIGLWQTGIEAINWHEQIILALLFANQIIAQGLFIIFAAVSFGSETTWHTWKNIIPRTSRTKLVIAKVLMIAIAILLATQGMALATLIGSWEISVFIGVPFVSEAWDSSGLSFIEQYFWITFALFFNYLIGALYAANAAILTRSTTAAVIIGIIILFGDIVSQAAFSAMSALLQIDFLATIPHWFPNYNIQNLNLLVLEGITFSNHPLWLSLMILIVWIVAGIGLAVMAFKRQDIH